VYKGPSWLDNKDALFLDYRDFAASDWIVTKSVKSPSRVIWAKFVGAKKRLIDFALEFPASG